ncbi:Aldehyde dehydrogenase family 8 member A1 [Zancudomyces culisetae]|uniref:Aldehyde dehydrogenase family 8 member A1 n=1 Tax=Zancudomyces culisetae TaxID=1213189 RepID=A0A1R1PGG5_ZANCU|nr:Aldehyde dehydrogenase family 8 member A1 [Zancudomyces culisetae]|eukprot:OMH80037.1 Aldehyde dehydrogenase family 8 member A1 [Zancudomyces culisetae]
MTQILHENLIPDPFTEQVTVRNYFDGEWHEPSNGQYLDNYNPSTGKVYSKIPDSSAEDVSRAVAAAKKAFPVWSTTDKETRAKLVHKLADLLEENLEAFAQYETMDQGKTLTMSRNVDIARAVYNFRYFANLLTGQTTEHVGETKYMKMVTDSAGAPIKANALSYTNRTPVGVAGLISPWNLPLYLLTWKIAPCIVAGNTCVCKPSEFTSVTAMMLTRLVKAAGIPDGVINMVFGLGASVGNSIVTHPDVPLISFTGGTVTGKHIARTAAPLFKHISLELGGKNPALVFADSNYDETLTSLVKASFLNQGEICLCPSRIYVEKSIYERFVTDFRQLARKLIRVGNPTEKTSYYGPLVSQIHYDKVQSYVKYALEQGYDVDFCVDRELRPEVSSISETGALTISGCEGGYFMAPTVITGCSQKSRLVQEEIFGPVVVILPFDDEAQAIEYANDTSYGLSATVWSQEQTKLRRVAGQIVAGTVWCNCFLVRNLDMPFGGFKSSGVGTEGGVHSIEFFTKVQTICLG